MITIETTVNAPIEKVWKLWNDPVHIIKWNSASPDWHTPKAENDVKVGGKFKFTMAAKDGSMSFDFEGDYTTVKTNEKIEYKMADGRKASILFVQQGQGVKITESFDPENENPHEMQRAGWQAILDSFKNYTEKQ